jgi:hypothetical protein
MVEGASDPAAWAAAEAAAEHHPRRPRARSRRPRRASRSGRDRRCRVHVQGCARGRGRGPPRGPASAARPRATGPGSARPTRRREARLAGPRVEVAHLDLVAGLLPAGRDVADLPGDPRRAGSDAERLLEVFEADPRDLHACGRSVRAHLRAPPLLRTSSPAAPPEEEGGADRRRRSGGTATAPPARRARDLRSHQVLLARRCRVAGRTTRSARPGSCGRSRRRPGRPSCP